MTLCLTKKSVLLCGLKTLENIRTEGWSFLSQQGSRDKLPFLISLMVFNAFA